jgi:hypothetical protein
VSRIDFLLVGLESATSLVFVDSAGCVGAGQGLVGWLGWGAHTRLVQPNVDIEIDLESRESATTAALVAGTTRQASDWMGRQIWNVARSISVGKSNDGINAAKRACLLGVDQIDWLIELRA